MMSPELIREKQIKAVKIRYCKVKREGLEKFIKSRSNV